MKKIAIALITMLLLGITGISYAYQQYRCPYDDSICYDTGKVDIIKGRVFLVYKCPLGHYFHVKR